MTERDWRTVCKSTYILHCISRDCSADVCDRFSSAIKSMSKTREIKTDTRYFDTRTITDLNDDSENYEDFITAYSNYVINRAKYSSSKFDELKSLDCSGSTSEKVAVAKMKRSIKTLQLGLKVKMESRKQRSVLIGQAVR